MTSGLVPQGTSSATPPPSWMRAAIQAAAVSMSPACAASALTDGIAMNSARLSISASDGGVTAAQSSQAEAAGSGLGDVADALGVGKRAELLQPLVLDLANALARHVERTPDLVERPRLLAVEAVAQLEDAALALGQRLEDLPQRLALERGLRELVRQRRRLVGEEVPELGLVVVADRLLERDRRLGAA